MIVKTSSKESEVVAHMAFAQQKLIGIAKEILEIYDEKQVVVEVKGAFSYKITIQVT